MHFFVDVLPSSLLRLKLRVESHDIGPQIGLHQAQYLSLTENLYLGVQNRDPSARTVINAFFLLKIFKF